MLISVIVCTYRRPEQVVTLLTCLRDQTYRKFEVLLVDGSGDAACRNSQLAADTYGTGLNIRVIASARGLTRQRNVGLDAAEGEIICLLDDDVALEADFLEKIVATFERPEMKDVGGLSAYDTLNYPQPINIRWRLRRFLRIIPSLKPGDIDRLGNSVPVSFFEPFSGCRPVGFFYGFCMIYRADAIAGMYFDEELPTYGGEDRDFSFRVSRRWRLMLCGDMRIKHFQAVQSRDSKVQRTYQTGFGAGRTFAKQRTNSLDYASLIRSMFCEFAIDSLAFCSHPSGERLKQVFARVAGTVAGVRSYQIPRCTSALDTVA